MKYYHGGGGPRTVVEGGLRCRHCGRWAALGTEVCTRHGARLVRTQLASDTKRLRERLEEHLRWLGEVEVRWVRCGGSPARWRQLVGEGRVEEAVSWLERVEAGWWDRLPDTAP